MSISQQYLIVQPIKNIRSEIDELNGVICKRVIMNIIVRIKACRRENLKDVFLRTSFLRKICRWDL